MSVMLKYLIVKKWFIMSLYALGLRQISLRKRI